MPKCKFYIGVKQLSEVQSEELIELLKEAVKKLYDEAEHETDQQHLG